MEVCFLISSLLTAPAQQRALSLEDGGSGGGLRTFEWQRELCFWVWPTRPTPCPGLPRGCYVMRGGDKEIQRRGTERGGEGRMERGGDGEGESSGGHPSNLLSI
ncbi:unnamed protein product [Pleuronectes platessa]|uniref:Uncharacterized protein n=1 Tax=Pleuronectes platessa TaxID=8262 RepID=A0A9N7YZS6_PLEPL|nr:unnamed protein product [Pleuronectes platessa]